MKQSYTVTSGGQTREAVLETLADDRYRLTVGDETVELSARCLGQGEYLLLQDNQVHDVLVSGRGPDFKVLERYGERSLQVLDEQQRARLERGRGKQHHADGTAAIHAPMPGKVVKILVSEGAEVDENQGVLVVEAMKMENELRSPMAGVIKRILVKQGDAVESGQELVLIE